MTRDAIAALVPLILAAVLFGAACLLAGCARDDGSMPRRVVTWPPIYGCVDPHGATCATPMPTRIIP